MPRRFLLLFLALALLSPALIGCLAQPITLEGVELKEYQGQNLSSITTLPDNSIRGPQRIAKDDYRLEIAGLVERPVSLTYDQVLERQQYNKVITLNCVEGWSATMLWEGVLIDDLLEQAGVTGEAVTVIFHSLDKYTTSLSLDFVRANKIMLAHKLNSVALPPERGFPFQVVAEDKWGYKWAKWVQKIELSADPDYRGYWESRGYNSNGDLRGSFLGGR